MTNTTSNNQLENQCQKMAQLANEYLPLNRWGFDQSAYLPGRNPQVIYDSESCRVKFLWDGWDAYTGDMISIYYGRLHAPNDKSVIMWNKEECHCWHRIIEPLLFLDGLSPSEAVGNSTHGHQPDIMDRFAQSELGKSLARNQPEWLVGMHAVIWENYGQRLFELFDLRRPHLWEQYRNFIKMYYEVKGLIPEITPAQDKIC